VLCGDELREEKMYLGEIGIVKEREKEIRKRKKRLYQIVRIKRCIKFKVATAHCGMYIWNL